MGGALVYDHVVEIKQVLLEALASHKILEIHLGNVEKVDFSFLQLLCATEKSALNQKKSVSITGEIPESVKNAARDSGFSHHPILAGVLA